MILKSGNWTSLKFPRHFPSPILNTLYNTFYILHKSNNLKDESDNKSGMLELYWMIIGTTEGKGIKGLVFTNLRL